MHRQIKLSVKNVALKSYNLIIENLGEGVELNIVRVKSEVSVLRG